MAAETVSHTIAIIGLGYVGLPLAIQFGARRNRASNSDARYHCRTFALGLSRRKVFSPHVAEPSIGEHPHI